MESSDEDSAAFSSEHEEPGDESDYVDYVAVMYERIVEDLRNNNCTTLALGQSEEVFCRVLENIDEFCNALSSSDGVTLVSMRSAVRRGSGLMLNEGNKGAWKKYWKAIFECPTVKELELDCYFLGNAAMLHALGNLPPAVRKLHLNLLLHDFDSHEKVKLIQYLSRHTFNQVELMLTGKAAFSFKSTPLSLDPEGAFSSLCRMNGLSTLCLVGLDLTPEDCRILSLFMKSDSCMLEELSLSRCTLPNDQRGQQVANALASNTSLKHISLTASFCSDAFCKGLLSSLSSSTSVEDINIGGFGAASDQKNSFVKALFFNICRHSKTIKKVTIANNSLLEMFSESEKYQEMEETVKHSYTLEDIHVRGPVSQPHVYPFQTILRLNKAGRRYLVNDGQSRSKCIAVLAKVKHDLDCLYFHMRENPILCMAAAASSYIVNGKKRKATDECISTESKSRS